MELTSNNELLKQELVESAWGIIANVSGGDWELQSKEWREAAVRWREDWHRWLETLPQSGAVEEAVPGND